MHFRHGISTSPKKFIHPVSSNCRSFGLDIRKNSTSYALQHADLNTIEERNVGSLNNGLLVGSLSRCCTSLRTCSSVAASAKAHFSCTDQSKEAEKVTNVPSSNSQGIEFNRVDYVVRVLHESARSFSQAVESLGLARCGPELAMAWIGKDVHEWHRRIAYQVYAAKCSLIEKYVCSCLLQVNFFDIISEIMM